MWDEEFGRRVWAAASQQRKRNGTSESEGHSRRNSDSNERSSSRAGRGRTMRRMGQSGRVGAVARSGAATADEAETSSARRGARQNKHRPPVPPKARQTQQTEKQRRPQVSGDGRQRLRRSHSSENDGESPTLRVADTNSVGVVTRSMARRMKAQARRRTSTGSGSGSASEATVATDAGRQTRRISGMDVASDSGPAVHSAAEGEYRRVRRSPQFHYDRFIPARSPELSSELRRLDAVPRASSPTFAQVEHTAQVEEANRTYDALLRAELLNDRLPADDLHPVRRAASPVGRVTYAASPTQLPSLVPWSGGAGSSSSRPNTPPSSPGRAPMFAYRSPRKPAGAAPARNLFGRASPVHEVYQSGAVGARGRHMLGTRTVPRRIARDPVKVLDAPGIRDDYYLNLLDWSSSDRIAVGLDREVYVWDAQTSATSRLCGVGDDDWVTSVGWADDGRYLAVGLNSGIVQLWDSARERRVREFAAHTRRVGALSWNGPVVSTGGRDKRIYSFDSRMRAGAVVSTYYGHAQEVCGLRWSPDRTQLASGGNDNMLLVWDTRFTPLDARMSPPLPAMAAGARAFRRPLFRLSQHTAAVKALAWSPTQRGLLASGGGTDDRCIRLWCTLTGRHISAHDTRSQVCNLAWATDGTELVSTHGFSENHVAVWRYPDMRLACTLPGHSRRVLYLAQSPDGRTIATAAADETIRFWDVFPRAAAPASVALPAPATVPSADHGVLLDDLAHVR
ncbi:substrate-specific activator of APC-dependent proteolysis [Coemansia sp. RSA 1365]|nr:substrate-specific activator of APC-dependent proteolysis [Coemansia sp. RSA 1365]